MSRNKTELRRQLKANRAKIRPEDKMAIDAEIYKRLIGLNKWQPHIKVHIYRAIKSLDEVDTDRFIDYLLSKQIYVYSFNKIDKHWITLPISSQKHQNPQRFDIVIVPILGFDKAGNRLGYGGGQYDKFLAAQPKAMKIGLCASINEVRELPVEPYDVAMDMIITENDNYSFKLPTHS